MTTDNPDTNKSIDGVPIIGSNDDVVPVDEFPEKDDNRTTRENGDDNE